MSAVSLYLKDKNGVISIALLFVLVLIIAKIAIKVYSSAILNYGSKMSFKDAFKIFKDK